LIFPFIQSGIVLAIVEIRRSIQITNVALCNLNDASNVCAKLSMTRLIMTFSVAFRPFKLICHKNKISSKINIAILASIFMLERCSISGTEN